MRSIPPTVSPGAGNDIARNADASTDSSPPPHPWTQAHTSTATERQRPLIAEAERAVLGGCLVNQQHVATVRDVLGDGADFATGDHRAIWPSTSSGGAKTGPDIEHPAASGSIRRRKGMML